MSIRIACALCACLLAVSAPPALASVGDEPAAAPLSLREAVDAAMRGNPELRSFAFDLRAQQARGEAAVLRPPLQLGLELEDVLGSGRFRGADAAQATFALSQVIELGAKREARVAAAQAGADVLQVERQARQLDVLAEVSRRYIHVASDQALLQLTRLATALARQTVAATQQRVDAAKAPTVELRRARVALARAEVEEEHAEHELLTSRHNLAAMWGETTPAFGEVSADLFRLPQPAAFEVLAAALANNPDAQRYATEARLRDAELRLAESRRRSDLGLSAGLRRFEEGSEQALVFGMSMPLFASRRAAPEIAEAQSLRERVDADGEAHRVRLRARLLELHQELVHAVTEAETLRDRVLPEMEAALEETRYAYQRGRYGYLEWAEAQRERVDVQRALIEAAANAHRYQTEIERLTGVALPAVAAGDTP